MKRFNDYLRLLDEARTFAKDIDSFDFGKHDKGSPGTQTTYNSTDLPTFGYKATELAILESFGEENKPLMIYGDSGIGKSVIVRTVAEKMIAPDRGRVFARWDDFSEDEKVRLIEDEDLQKKFYIFLDKKAAQFNPETLQGLELPSSEKPYLNPKVNKWIWYIIQPHSGGVLFLDEVNQAIDQVFNQLFDVILENRVAETTFNKEWNVIAAGNLGKGHRTAQKLPYALTQRFATMMLVANAKEWGNWALDMTEEGYTRVHPSVVMYARSEPSMTFLAENKAGDSHSAPNPRNLEAFSMDLRSIIEGYNNGTLEGDIFSHIKRRASVNCGGKWSDGFVQFMRTYSKLDWDDLAENAKKHATTEMEDTFAYMQFISARVMKELGKDSEFNNLCNQIHQTVQGGGSPDMAALQKPYAFVKQFLQICQHLIYQVKDTDNDYQEDDDSIQPSTGSAAQIEQIVEQQIKGDGENLAILLSQMNRIDRTAMKNVLFIMKFFPQENLKMRKIFKDTIAITKLDDDTANSAASYARGNVKSAYTATTPPNSLLDQ